MKPSCCLLLMSTASILISCASYDARTQTKSGGDFLIRLHKKGELPGDAKEAQGRITCYLSPSDLEQTIYPLTRTYQVVNSNDSFTNNYMVGRIAKHSTWQLQRAWRTDRQGHVTEEWAVK